MDTLRHPPRPCGCTDLIESYERLAELYHDLLGQRSLRELLERAADSVAAIVPCTSLLIAETDREAEVVVPLVTRGSWGDETLQVRPRFGEGLIGWAVANGRPVLANDAHLDPRAGHVAGTPDGEPEAIICLPLIARGTVIGALNIYREGGDTFTETEFAMGRRLADAVTLALEHATSREQLETLARTDHLTGCLNRRGLHDEITRLTVGARRDDRIALLLVDLNEFKCINDRHGHTTGDLVLTHVAARLRDAAPAGAVIARLGGDEFAVALPLHDGDARSTAIALEAAINSLTVVARGAAVAVSATIGTAVVRASASNLEERLLSLADHDMYAGKTRAAAP